MGSRMVEILAERGGYFIIGTDLFQREEGRWNIFLTADLTDKESAKRMMALVVGMYGPIDVVFHIAGLFDYNAPPSALLDVNVNGTHYLFEAISSQNMKPRVILWGAAGTYRFPTTPDEPRTETSPFGINGSYLKSKLQQEFTARDRAQGYDIPLTIIRPSGVYGPGAKYGLGHTIMMAGLGMMGPIAPNTGKRRGSTVHVDDVCGAALFLSEQPEKNVAGKAFNVCDDAVYTLDEVTRFIAREVGFRFMRWLEAPLWLVEHANRGLVKKAKKLDRVSLVHPDMSRLLAYDTLMSNAALRALGWEPKYPDPKVGLKKTIEWYKQEGLMGDKNFHELKFDLWRSAFVWTILLPLFLPILVGMATRRFGTPIHAVLSVLTLVTCLVGPWLAYRLWFVRRGFKNLDNWTRPKR